jgi:hypothetical protein
VIVKHEKVRSVSNVNKILILISVIFSIVFYWFAIRPTLIKKDCSKLVYGKRLNENNYDWAEGKKWLPKPGNQVTDKESYVWIYVDQSNTEAYVKRSIQQAKDYKKCLIQRGL